MTFGCYLCGGHGLSETATHLVQLRRGSDPVTLLYVCRQHAETLVSDPDLFSWEHLTS